MRKKVLSLFALSAVLIGSATFGAMPRAASAHEAEKEKIDIDRFEKAIKKLASSTIGFFTDGDNISFFKNSKSMASRELTDDNSVHKIKTISADRHSDDDNSSDDGSSGSSDDSTSGSDDSNDENLPPSIEGITAPTVLKVGEAGKWIVKASDPENGSLTYAVDWGDDQIKMMDWTGSSLFVQSAEFTHTYQKAGTFKASFTVKDDAGQTESASATVKVVESDDNDQTLKITNLQTSQIKATQAKVSWSTNENADTRIWISKTTPVNTGGNPNIKRSALIKNHVLTLTNLTPNTTYYLVGGSRNHKGQLVKSKEISFTTLGKANKPPVIVSVDGPKKLMTDEKGTWTIKATDPEDGSLSYMIDWGDDSLSPASFTQTSTFTHTYAKKGDFKIKFTVKDDANQTASSTVSVTVTAKDENEKDTASPIISNVSFVTSTSTIEVNWTTDEPTKSKIFFSQSSPVNVKDQKTPVINESGDLKTEHSLTLTDLKPNTNYFLVIQSMDKAGNTATSDESSLMTE